MNIIEFYKSLSNILEICREKVISHAEAEYRLKLLLEEANESNLDVDIDDNILEIDNLVRYDDEKSYEENFDDDTSFEDY